ncbi:MAG TPA: TetR family transcriptional regulator C-terminal domain-containing protein [Nonomuraea sp.]|nr:TetR family transcriptional regulator C-terminal domain-containing protein [Nonomuraea sp.]
MELFIEVLLPDWHVATAEDLPTQATDVASFLEAYARHWVARLRAGDTRRAFELELELYLAAIRDPRLLAKTKAIFASSEQRLTAHLEHLASDGPPMRIAAAELARTLVAAMQGLSQLAVALDEEPDEEMFVRVARRLGENVGNGSPEPG